MSEREKYHEKSCLDKDGPEPEISEPEKLHQPTEKRLIEHYRERYQHELIEHEPEKLRLYKRRETIIRLERRKFYQEKHSYSPERHAGHTRENAWPEITFLPAHIFQGLLEYYFTIQQRNHQEKNTAHDEPLKHRAHFVALGEKPEKPEGEKDESTSHNKSAVF